MTYGNLAVNRGYSRCTTISKSDTVSIATGITDAILVLTAGNLVMIDEAGNSVTCTVITGSVLPLRLIRIDSTNSTATAAALYVV